MNPLINQLRRLNRKERFLLLKTVVGEDRFTLGETFRSDVGNALNLAIPEDAFFAMDYHMDWILVALASVYDPANVSGVYTTGPINKNQEDVDLLIAFPQGETTHLVLVEAKGVGTWSNEQLQSKVKRLTGIFGENGNTYPFVTPHLLLTSPRESKGLEIDEFPAWVLNDGKIHWIQLPMPDDLQQATRCTEDGVITATGTSWRLVSAPSAPS